MDTKILSLYRDVVFSATSEKMLVEKTVSMITGKTRYDVRINIIQENGSAGDFVNKILKNKISESRIEKFLSNQPVMIMDKEEVSGLVQDADPCLVASALLIPFFNPRDREKSTCLGLFLILSPDNSLFERETVKRFQKLAGHLAYDLTAFRMESLLKVKMEKLKNQKVMYHSLFENTGTGTIIIDNDMLILFANTKFVQLTGYSREEVENTMHWSQFVIPEDQKKMHHYHYGRRKGLPDIPSEYECGIFDKAGQIKYMHMKVGMMTGTTISIVSFMDISLGKVAENRLRKSEYLLKSIVGSFQGFIFTVTRDYCIQFMNRALINWAGYNALNEKCHKVIYGREAPCPWCELKNIFMGNLAKPEEKSLRDNRWYSVTQSPIYDRISRITGLQVVMVDITERKLREEKITERADYYRSENSILRSAMKERHRFEESVGKSDGMQKVYELILQAASSNAHVVLYGESGAGNEFVATTVHKLSRRSNHMFVPVSWAAINGHFIESGFSGCRKGAFTGANRNKTGFPEQLIFPKLLLAANRDDK